MLPQPPMLLTAHAVAGSAVFLAQAANTGALTQAPVSSGIDYWAVVTGGSPVVVSVLGLLLLASVVSWAIIVRKALHLGAAQRQSAKFLNIFWQAKRLDAIYQEAEAFPLSPVSQVFRAGYVELSKVTQAVEEERGSAAMSEHLS